jgi:hypothetical protein
MYAGPLCATIDRGPGWRQCHNTVCHVLVGAPTAARVYELNLRSWRDDPHIRDRHPADRIDGLARDLGVLAASTAADPVVWSVRQIAYERDPPVDAGD